MSENFQVGLPVVMGLALSIAWYFGYDAVALWIFIVTFVVLFAGHVHKVQGLARGIAVDTGERMAESVAALMSETPGQDRATSISATMGEVACWPFRMIIGVVISNVLERVLFRRTPLANLTERAACLWFVIPLVLLVLLSMALQCWFLLTQFPTETRILWAFQATVGITTAGYVGFLAHFSMRRDFLRNFTSSAVPPGLYFVLALILVFVTAILIRLTFDVTFYGGSDTLSADNAFDTARAIVLNPGIFDIPDALKEAQSLADMRSRFGAYVSDMTLQRALDIFLGFSILTTFGRSAMSALVARRSDEDRMKRAMAFLRMGWWDRIEAEANEMQDRKFWGALMCFVALHKRDINQFEAAALEADLPSSVNSLGPEPAVQLYYGVLDYAWSVPIDVTEMLALADFAGEHGLGRAAQMQLLNVYSIIRPFPHAAFDALIETSVTAKASFEMRQLVGEIGNPEADILEKTKTAFPVDTDIAISALAAVALGLLWRMEATDEVRELLRKNLGLLYREMGKVLDQPGKVPLLYLAVASHLFQGAKTYAQAFGEGENPAADLLAKAESRLRAYRRTYPHQLRRLSEAEMRR